MISIIYLQEEVEFLGLKDHQYKARDQPEVEVLAIVDICERQSMFR
jgi:hypothetical protein